jgi:hypothetical protein
VLNNARTSNADASRKNCVKPTAIRTSSWPRWLMSCVKSLDASPEQSADSASSRVGNGSAERVYEMMERQVNHMVRLTAGVLLQSDGKGVNMSDQLKPGDRVRVTDRNRVQGYEAGDKGMVQTVASIPAIGNQLHYQVAMDRDGGVSRSVFAAEEIELDVGPIRGYAEDLDSVGKRPVRYRG